MGQKYLPPLCLFCALVLVISGFSLESSGGPEADMELHRARLTGQEAYQERLEKELEQRRWSRTALIYALYGCALLFTVAAFWTMNPRRTTSPDRDGDREPGIRTPPPGGPPPGGPPPRS